MTKRISRREAITAGLAGAAAFGACGNGAGETGAPESAPATSPPQPGSGVRTAVIGAGAFGAWTALNLQQSGAGVALIDQYGPGNSRATSGGETRGAPVTRNASGARSAAIARRRALSRERK